MDAGGQAGTGEWNGLGREWRAFINNCNEWRLVGEGAGRRGMAKNGPKMRKCKNAK
jgi:hypothetical protein